MLDLIGAAIANPNAEKIGLFIITLVVLAILDRRLHSMVKEMARLTTRLDVIATSTVNDSRKLEAGLSAIRKEIANTLIHLIEARRTKDGG